MHFLKSFHFLISDAWEDSDSGCEIVPTHTINGRQLDIVVPKSR